jgi:acyl carrier protein
VLPEYMVPSVFRRLEVLPRTGNGKLDRRALPAPSGDEEAPRAAMVAPRTPTEALVLAGFQEVLGRADFGVSESFFDLGGHSITAARLMLRLRAATGCDLPLRLLFERPTVEGLAQAIDALTWVASAEHVPVGGGDRVEIEL